MISRHPGHPQNSCRVPSPSTPPTNPNIPKRINPKQLWRSETIPIAKIEIESKETKRRRKPPFLMPKNQGGVMFQECRHIKASGTKCEAPALKSEQFCISHSRSRAHARRHVDYYQAIEIPLLEDRSAIQHALTEVARAIANNNMDTKRAGLSSTRFRSPRRTPATRTKSSAAKSRCAKSPAPKKEPTSARRPPPATVPQPCPTVGSSRPSKRTMKPRRKRSLSFTRKLNQPDLKPDPTGI